MNFQELSAGTNGSIFVICAGIVWIFGSRLSHTVDALAARTGIGHAFMGAFLLGGVTSLPEIATVTSASLRGNVPLAVNNMLGSIAINLVFLAVADRLLGRGALTSVVAQPATLLQGTLCILLLTIVGMAGVTGGGTWGPASPWSWGLIPTFVFSMWLASRYREHAPWIIKSDTGRTSEKAAPPRSSDESRLKEHSMTGLVLRLVVEATMIFVGGFLLAATADALVVQTGVGANVFGLVLLSAATGLPEISSIRSAVRIGRSEMAVGDIFGTNLWNVAIIALADFLSPRESVYARIGPFERVATLLTIVLTCIYMVGFLERRDRTLWKMGYDSIAVVAVYVGCLFLLYTLRGAA